MKNKNYNIFFLFITFNIFSQDFKEAPYAKLLLPEFSVTKSKQNNIYLSCRVGISYSIKDSNSQTIVTQNADENFVTLINNKENNHSFGMTRSVFPGNYTVEMKNTSQNNNLELSFIGYDFIKTPDDFYAGQNLNTSKMYFNHQLLKGQSKTQQINVSNPKSSGNLIYSNGVIQKKIEFFPGGSINGKYYFEDLTYGNGVQILVSPNESNSTVDRYN